MNVQFKEDLLEAYKTLGGTRWLVQMGVEYPQDFLKMMAKLLPKEIVAEVSVTNPADELVKLQERAANARRNRT
jgi:hypothetical protein